MKLPVHKFISNVMDGGNLNEILVNYGNKTWIILHPNIYVMEYCHEWLKFVTWSMAKYATL